MGTQDMDLSEFTQLAPPKKRRCPLGPVLQDLAAPDEAKLRAALELAKEDVSSTAIVLWVKARFPDSYVSVGYVTSHRAGTCSCHD